MNQLKEVAKKNTMLIALAFVMVLFQILITIKSGGNSSLFAPANITNLISQNSYVVILACGMLLCILTGGNIDLSVGSQVALIGAIAGTLIVNLKFNFYLSILICLLVGVCLGAWQGFWIAYVRIPAFIVTLAGMLLFRGIAGVVLNGFTISPFPPNYKNYFSSFLPGVFAPGSEFIFTMVIAVIICAAIIFMQVWTRMTKIKKNYYVEPMAFLVVRVTLVCAAILAAFFLLGQDKGMPVVLIWLAVVVLVYNYYTQNTVPGRRLYAMGGNEKAAMLSGVNTNRMLFFAYTNLGFLAALASLVLAARFDSVSPKTGESYELDAIGACFIGGASAYGGTGTVFGAVIGAIFMGVLNNGMSILGIDANWQKAVKGGVLLAAVVFDVLSKRRKRSA